MHADGLETGALERIPGGFQSIGCELHFAISDLVNLLQNFARIAPDDVPDRIKLNA